MRQSIPNPIAVMVSLGVLVALAGTASALEIQHSGYDYWHQYHALHRDGVLRLNLFDANPMREAGPPPLYTTTFTQNANALATAVVIDPEFIITTATPMLMSGDFTVVVNDVQYRAEDFWVPGPPGFFDLFNEDADSDNFALIRLDKPLPASVPVYSLPAPTANFKGQVVEIVSYGELVTPDMGAILGSAGIRRSGFNKLDVREINENLDGAGLIGMDQDEWPPTRDLFDPFTQGIHPNFDFETDVPVVLEAVPAAEDAGSPAFVGNTLAAILGGSYTVEFGKNTGRTFVNFVDMVDWQDDIGHFLDRTNWVGPDLDGDGFGDFPARPPVGTEPNSPTSFYEFGWLRLLPGYDVEFVRNEGPEMILIGDTDVTPQALEPMASPAAPAQSVAQAISEATIEFLNFLEEREIFGSDARISLLDGALGVFANSSNDDFASAGAPGPIDFTDVDLPPVQMALLIDFNRDTEINSKDIDALYGNVGLVIGPQTDILHGTMDLDFDGAVTQDDVDFFVEDVLGVPYGDLNLDGLVNHVDKQTLEANLDTPGVWGLGDVNGSGVVDAADLAILMSNLTLLLGDANNDGMVTGSDLIIVQQNFAATGDPDGLLLGDANDDGVVTGADLIAVQQQFGNLFGQVVATAPIPEPATIAMLLFGAVALRRRQST